MCCNYDGASGCATEVLPRGCHYLWLQPRRHARGASRVLLRAAEADPDQSIKPGPGFTATVSQTRRLRCDVCRTMTEVILMDRLGLQTAAVTPAEELWTLNADVCICTQAESSARYRNATPAQAACELQLKPIRVRGSRDHHGC